MKRTVYVVDDEDPIRRALRLMLSVRGYAVTLFNSGQTFLDVCESLVPGSLLLDVRMPEMDGIEVQRRLNEKRPDLPVIVMTGHGDLNVALAALQNGAVSFVEKPFSKSHLGEALRKAFLKLEDPDGFAEMNGLTAALVARLAEEDRAILAGIAAGRSHQDIAAELAIDPALVEARRARLLSELGLESLGDLLLVAFAAGYSPGLRDNT